jgi:hypothetical protein
MNAKKTLTRTAFSIAIGLGFATAYAQTHTTQQRQQVQHPAQGGAQPRYQGGLRVNPPRNLRGRDMTPRQLTSGGVQANSRMMNGRQIPVRGTDDAKAGGMEQTHPGANAVRTRYGTPHETNTPRLEAGQQSTTQQSAQTGLQGSAYATAQCDHPVPLNNGWRIKERRENGSCLWEIPPEVRALYQQQGQQGNPVQQSQATGTQQVVPGSLLNRNPVQQSQATGTQQVVPGSLLNRTPGAR